ncbi:AAA family ATPase [Fimbriiglobus ruber]|uniref:ATP binding protein n=1 Tax=Fimbriiglobus ruber TaxID=1908690 RepID=A0A225DKG4_9BACT|nr:AAA family ATPase [Fimbriiglobus ruber]OWK37956.1 ATP binding protein [Fimbriiglobus ruber]
MIFQSIELINFRCFASLAVPLDPQLNVFVGGNGAGKTALLDGLALALAPVLTRLPFDKKPKVPFIVSSDIHLTGEDHSAPFTHVAAGGRVERAAPLTWGRTHFRDKSPGTKNQAPQGRKDLKELHQYLDRVTDAHNANASYTLPVFAYYGTNRAVNVPHYRLRRQVTPKHFRRLAGLENALQTTTDFRQALGWFDFFEQRELREQRDKVIEGRLPALECVRRAITSMIPDVRNPRIDGTTGRFAVDRNDPGGTNIRLHLDQLSDGYQVMLGVVMDFALRLALANPPEKTNDDPLLSEAILVIDEVDLHLHPSWQQRVIPDLRRTFPNTQLVLTTHSPQVTTTVPSENLRILSRSQLFAAPGGTDGAEAQRLLEDVFGVKPRPDVSTAKDLDEYLRLVDTRQWDSDKARSLRARLDDWSRGAEPRLIEADLQIENQKWEAGQ